MDSSSRVDVPRVVLLYCTMCRCPDSRPVSLWTTYVTCQDGKLKLFYLSPESALSVLTRTPSLALFLLSLPPFLTDEQQHLRGPHGRSPDISVHCTVAWILRDLSSEVDK